MNNSKFRPISATVLALVGTGRVVATAQNLTAETGAATETRVMQGNTFEGGHGDGHGKARGDGHGP